MLQKMGANKDSNVIAGEPDASHKAMRKDHSMHGMTSDEKKANEPADNPKQGGL